MRDTFRSVPCFLAPRMIKSRTPTETPNRKDRIQDPPPTMTKMTLLIPRCSRPLMPFNIPYLLLSFIAIPSLVQSFLPITHRPSPASHKLGLQQAPRQQQQSQQQLERTCLKMSTSSHPLSQDKHVETILFVECGTFVFMGHVER